MYTVIALDIGTTHMKSILFDQDGAIICQKKCATPLKNSGDGEIYHTEEIWKIIKDQIDTLCDICQEPPLGISITGMAEAGVIINRTTGEALTDILPWFDRRTLALAEMETAEEAREIVKTTGLRNSFKYGIYKYRWLLKEQKLAPEDTVWLSVCDYAAYRLTGIPATDPTFAARTYVYDVLHGCWDEDRIRTYGLQLDNFPKLVSSGEPMGVYRNIPVAIAGHDHLCAAFGLLNHHPDAVCDSAGTSETYIGLLPDAEAIEASGFPEESGLLYGPFVDGGYYFMANVPSSGHSIEWYRKSLQLQELSYEEMNRNLSCLERGPVGILYYPYLTGMGAPWYRADMKGAFIGLTDRHNGIQVLKGIVEGIQYQGKWLMELAAEHHGIRRTELACAGGAVHNRGMMQGKADILNMTVQIPNVTEATLCGAAALFIKNYKGKEAAERFLAEPLAIRQSYQPGEPYVQAYETVFKKQYLPIAGVLGTIGK